jgi:hypothetical protein
MKRKVSKRELKKLRDKLQPMLSNLDPSNRLLKLRFGVKGVNYVTDNGVIQNGWLLSDKQDTQEAAALLEKQTAPVYILGEYFNAVFAWDAIRSTVVASLWKSGKKVDESRSIDTKQIKLTMDEWFDRVTKGDEK